MLGQQFAQKCRKFKNKYKINNFVKYCYFAYLP